MKAVIEQKTCDMETFDKEIVQLKASVQERDIELDGLKDDLKVLKNSEDLLRRKSHGLEATEADLRLELDQIHVKSNREAEKLKEFYQDEMKVLKAEQEIQVRLNLSILQNCLLKV